MPPLISWQWSEMCSFISKPFLSASPQWGFRAIRAIPRSATGKILCWTLTASPPSTPRPADPTITTTTTTTPRASVRTSNPAWCELSCHCGLQNKRGITATSEQTRRSFFFFGLFVFFVIFEGFMLAWMVESALTCLPPMQPNIFIIVNSAGLELCIEENMNEETPEAFRSTTSPIWTLTSFLLQEKFQKHDFRCVCSCNTCKPIILHVTVSYYTHNALGFHELQRILHLLYNPFTIFSFCFVL